MHLGTEKLDLYNCSSTIHPRQSILWIFLPPTGTGNPGSGLSSSLNSDGFTNISISASATDANSNTFDIFQHRTAKYIVHSASQRRGWNYAFVRHTVGSANYDTNYVEWVNVDESTNVTIRKYLNKHYTKRLKVYFWCSVQHWCDCRL